MQPPGSRRFAVNERLHSQADAVHAGRNQRLQSLIGKLARRAFDSNFGVRLQVKLPAHGGEQARQQLGGEQTRRSAAQVDRVHAARKLHAHPRSPCGGRG